MQLKHLPLLFIPVAAMAQELPGEVDLQLALQAQVTSAQQVSRAWQIFSQSLKEVKQLGALAAYWQDACKSTPECGGR